VVHAVRSLPPRQRDAIVMRELEGRSYDEIGERLGASEGAVRQLLNRARRSLRETVGALVPGAPLLGSGLGAGDGPGARGALTLAGGSALGGGSALVTKLTGAAILSAVSMIALLPSPRAPAGGDEAGSRSGARRPGVAVLVAPTRSPQATAASLLGGRLVAAGHRWRPALQQSALVARPAPSGWRRSRPSSRRSSTARARDARGGLPTQTAAGRVNFGPRLRQSSSPSPRAGTVGPGAGGQAAGQGGQPNVRQPNVYNRGTPPQAQQPTNGPGG
jgi:hypothetical protein